MSYIYVYEHGTNIHFISNQICIENKAKAIKRLIPIEGVEAVVLIGGSSVSSECVKTLLARGISLTWLSSSGKFFGRLENTLNVNIERQRKQFKALENDQFCIEMARNIVISKINNQIVLAKRYIRIKDNSALYSEVNKMIYYKQKIKEEKGINEMRGYEGIVARIYFKLLSMLTDPEFSFDRRSRRPPLDKFNSLLSFGYTLLLNDIYSALVNKGLNPYVGYLHKIRNGNPALASDMIEEFRAPLIASMVMHIIAKAIIKSEDFQKPDDIEKGVYLKKDTAKKFINEYEKKIRTKTKYLMYTDFDVSFRRAAELQAEEMAKAIEMQDASIYKPVMIR